MKLRREMIPCLLAMAVAAGCASTKITSREELVTAKLPRPDHIWVYDFAATASDVPAESALAGHTSEVSQTDEQIAAGRKLGAEIASQLIEQIDGMGLTAAHAGPGTAMQTNDIVLRGYLVSVNKGSAAERLVIGFGAGAAQLQTAVEGFQVTPRGLRKLGFGTVESGGSKGPGAALGVAGLVATGNPAGLIVSTGVKVYEEESGASTIQGRAEQTAKEISGVLRQRFQQEGWI